MSNKFKLICGEIIEPEDVIFNQNYICWNELIQFQNKMGWIDCEDHLVSFKNEGIEEDFKEFRISYDIWDDDLSQCFRCPIHEEIKTISLDNLNDIVRLQIKHNSSWIFYFLAGINKDGIFLWKRMGSSIIEQ